MVKLTLQSLYEEWPFSGYHLTEHTITLFLLLVCDSKIGPHQKYIFAPGKFTAQNQIQGTGLSTLSYLFNMKIMHTIV